MKISVGISNRHVHLTKEDFIKLFGDIELDNVFELRQLGNYATKHFVTIKTNKNIIQKVRVLSPLRNYTQIEISKTDAYKLGVNPPIRESGDIVSSEIVTLIGPKGEITTNGCIIAQRHIHITAEDKIKYNLPDIVSLKINGEKSGIINNVHLKVMENTYLESHLDTDDGNAFLLKSNDEVEIIWN